jgi:hypothetical protein
VNLINGSTSDRNPKFNTDKDFDTLSAFTSEGWLYYIPYAEIATVKYNFRLNEHFGKYKIFDFSNIKELFSHHPDILEFIKKPQENCNDSRH